MMASGTQSDEEKGDHVSDNNLRNGWHTRGWALALPTIKKLGGRVGENARRFIFCSLKKKQKHFWVSRDPNTGWKHVCSASRGGVSACSELSE